MRVSHKQSAGEEEYVIPKALEEEGKKVKEKIDSLNLPKTADGKYPDICKISDAAAKKMVMDFIEKVNAAGGKIPKPAC